MRDGFEWLEIALDYRCNLRCLGCRACDGGDERLAAADALAILRGARARGVAKLWIGGGEPTLRPELPKLIAAARSLGFERVLLQTNGLRLAYASYAAAIVDAGLTDVSFNVKSLRAEVNDALTRTEGSQALLLEGIANVAAVARGQGVRLAADVLLCRDTAPDLAETVRAFAARGITRFTLWLLSAADSDDPEVARAVPRLDQLTGPIADAGRVADALGVELVSLHTPPCTLAPSDRPRYLPARSLRLLVVDPSGRSFPLESSPFEGGVYPEPCRACPVRESCGGARADYLRLHGDDALNPPGT
ncbi:MAG: radical SAM protein [Deltaproteobacteria bacterium]|nr:radical SAM protein [Deltaproteobacteria bacterium]